MIVNPMTNTRFNTLPTACVRGATLSRVLVANYFQTANIENILPAHNMTVC